MKLNFELDKFRAQPDPFMCETKEGWVMYVTGSEGIGAYKADSPFGTWKYKGLIFRMDGCREYCIFHAVMTECLNICMWQNPEARLDHSEM